jgi:hypothetical protein
VSWRGFNWWGRNGGRVRGYFYILYERGGGWRGGSDERRGMLGFCVSEERRDV